MNARGNARWESKTLLAAAQGLCPRLAFAKKISALGCRKIGPTGFGPMLKKLGSFRLKPGTSLCCCEPLWRLSRFCSDGFQGISWLTNDRLGRKKSPNCCFLWRQTCCLNFVDLLTLTYLELVASGKSDLLQCSWAFGVGLETKLFRSPQPLNHWEHQKQDSHSNIAIGPEKNI